MAKALAMATYPPRPVEAQWISVCAPAVNTGTQAQPKGRPALALCRCCMVSKVVHLYPLPAYVMR